MDSKRLRARSWGALDIGLCLAWGAATGWAAGPTAAEQVDRPIAAGVPWSGLDPLRPAPGWTLAWGGAARRPPVLVADPIGGRGGLHWQSGELERGPLRARSGLGLRTGATPRWSLEGSEIAYRLGGGYEGHGESGAERNTERNTERNGEGDHEIYASVQRRHWGPGWSGSLILDGAAPAVPALGWRRTGVRTSEDNPYLAWLGPWGGDLFVGRLQGHRQPARPALIGMRLLWMPVDRLELGFSRTMMWGGRGRDESARSLVNSLVGNDNVGFDGITAENEPGNQLAGVDLRWTVDPASRASIYLQVVGEDEAGHAPSRNFLLLGADAGVPAAGVEGAGARVFLEWVDLLAGRASRDPRPGVTYRHSVYLQGYTQQGVVLGHAAGGDVKLAITGGRVDAGPWQATFALALGRAEPSAQFFAPGRVLGSGALLRVRMDRGMQLGVGGQWWRDAQGRRHDWRIWWQGGAW